MAIQRNVNKGLWAYFILTYAIVLLTWGLMVVFQIPGASTASGAGTAALSAVLLLLGGTAPSIAGIVMTWRIEGRDGLRDLWKRATRINFGWRWYLTILLFPLLILGLRIVIQLARGGKLLESPLLTNPFNLIGFTIVIILSGPISEEFGWRGFALDRLLARRNVVVANLILGLIWAVFHLPLFFISGTLQQSWGNPLVQFPIFAVQVLGWAVFYNWLYIHTGRSVFAAMLVHLVVNWLGSLSVTFMNGGTIDHIVSAVAYAILGGVILISWRQNRRPTTEGRHEPTIVPTPIESPHP